MAHYLVVRRHSGREEIIGIERARNITELKKKMKYYYSGRKGTFVAFKISERGKILFRR